MEQMDCNLLFPRFVGLGINDPVWVPTVFPKNHDRLLTTAISCKLRAAILADDEVALLLSDEHFSVDGTLVEAGASMESFQPRADATPPDHEGPSDPLAPDTAPDTETSAETGTMPRNTKGHHTAEVDFRGEMCSTATHASTTDPDARLYQKSTGIGAMLSARPPST